MIIVMDSISQDLELILICNRCVFAVERATLFHNVVTLVNPHVAQTNETYAHGALRTFPR